MGLPPPPAPLPPPPLEADDVSAGRGFAFLSFTPPWMPAKSPPRPPPPPPPPPMAEAAPVALEPGDMAGGGAAAGLGGGGTAIMGGGAGATGRAGIGGGASPRAGSGGGGPRAGLGLGAIAAFSSGRSATALQPARPLRQTMVSPDTLPSSQSWASSASELGPYFVSTFGSRSNHVQPPDIAAYYCRLRKRGGRGQKIRGGAGPGPQSAVRAKFKFKLETESIDRNRNGWLASRI